MRPRRARRGANGLRYSLEETFPATAEERDGIERAAKAKGTWLKAPNGQDTKLTPKQWVTVRTRAFKKWFGDWEKSATLAKSFREEDSNANIIRVERDGYTDEFRRIQAESNRLLPEDISSLHRRDRRLSEDRRKSLAGAYGRLLGSGSRVGRSVWTHLTGKGNTFRIARVNGELFHDIFEINRKYLPNGELVDLHEDYSNAKCFLTDDGMCGFAIEEGGNLVSVFSLNPNNAKERQGFLHAIKDFAREQGATHLDAYASNKQPLDEIYAKTLGFHVAAEMDYAMEYDHDDIAANHGKPKVVFMVDSAAVERRKFDDYDAAVAYQRGATSAASASKVVDENGEPLVVWHGTDADFTVFDRAKIGSSTNNKGIFGNGFYMTEDSSYASYYNRSDGRINKDGRGRVMPLFVSLKNPFDWSAPDAVRVAEAAGFPKSRTKGTKLLPLTEEKQILSFTENLKKSGHDGVVFTFDDGTREFVAFEPEQIKSATENVGTFDAGNPDIRYSLGGGTSTIRAWHGSPHAFAAEEGAPFGRFGLSFVGTGEGAQVFGYGIYLTSEEDIARRNYAQRLGDDDVASAQRALGRFGLAWATFRADELAACVSFSDFKRELRAAAWSLEDLVEEGEMTAEELASDKASIREATKTREAFDALLSAMLATQDYFYESRREDIERALEEAGDGRKAKALREELERFDELKREADANERPRHHLYEARIRVADDASNLLDWVARPSEEQLERIRAGLRERGVSEEAAVRLTEPGSFGEIYRGISEELGGAAKASETLKAAGFAGHKYPADSVGTGAADYSRGTNYVIYDTGATEITDAVRWLRNDSGVVYGYWDEGSGELHLNEDFADFDTPLHEWAHVWLSWVRKADARLAERALAVTKETRFYKRLREDKGSAYAGLSDDALAEEAFAMLCGKDGGVPVLRVSSVAFDFAENFLQAANRGEGIVVPADGAHDGKVPRAGAEHGGQPRFVDPADGDGGTRRGVDHRAHGLQAQRRIGNFLGRRGVDGADADVVGSGGTRGSRLRERMRGEPENFQRREAFPCGGQRHVVLPEMHAVGLRFRGDFRIVVHDEERARSRSDAANVFRGFDDAFPRRALHAQLNETQACAHGCVRAGFITRRGIRDDEVKAEGIFHEEKKKKRGSAGIARGIPWRSRRRFSALQIFGDDARELASAFEHAAENRPHAEAALYVVRRHARGVKPGEQALRIFDGRAFAVFHPHGFFAENAAGGRIDFHAGLVHGLLNDFTRVSRAVDDGARRDDDGVDVHVEPPHRVPVDDDAGNHAVVENDVLDADCVENDRSRLARAENQPRRHFDGIERLVAVPERNRRDVEVVKNFRGVVLHDDFVHQHAAAPNAAAGRELAFVNGDFEARLRKVARGDEPARSRADDGYVHREIAFELFEKRAHDGARNLFFHDHGFCFLCFFFCVESKMNCPGTAPAGTRFPRSGDAGGFLFPQRGRAEKKRTQGYARSRRSARRKKKLAAPSRNWFLLPFLFSLTIK